jgi:hypothetical protein
MKDRTSRKWILTIAILIIASLTAFIPPIVFAALGKPPLMLMTSEVWVTVILIITSGYHFSNVMQKKIEQTPPAIDPGLINGVGSQETK